MAHKGRVCRLLCSTPLCRPGSGLIPPSLPTHPPTPRMDLPKHPDQLLNGPVQRLHGRPPHRPDAAARKPLQRVSVLDEPRPRAADAVDCDLAQARSPGEREVAAVGQRPLPHLAEEELPPPPRRALSGGSVLAAIHARAHKTTQTRARARARRTRSLSEGRPCSAKRQRSAGTARENGGTRAGATGRARQLAN